MKNILIAIVLLALLGVGGAFVMNSRQTHKVPNSMMKPTAQPKNNNVITSIKDALSKSVSLKCQYKDTQSTDVTTYIKAGSVRVSSVNTTGEAQMGNIIMKNSKMYIWDDKSKQGLIYTIDTNAISEQISGMPKVSQSPSANNDNKNSLLAQIEKYKDYCKPAVVEDTLFTPPADVKFQDMSAMMKSITGMPQMKQEVTP